MAVIDDLIAEAPSLQIVTRDGDEYTARRKIYNEIIDTNPAAFAVIKSVEEVATIVKFAGRTGLSIAVRCGGHDLFGRSLVEEGLVLDIRSLNSITVNKQSGTAVVGGGIQSEQVSRALAEHGCLTPCPNVASYAFSIHSASLC